MLSYIDNVISRTQFYPNLSKTINISEVIVDIMFDFSQNDKKNGLIDEYIGMGIMLNGVPKWNDIKNLNFVKPSLLCFDF